VKRATEQQLRERPSSFFKWPFPGDARGIVRFLCLEAGPTTKLEYCLRMEALLKPQTALEEKQGE
jgi:hypothetical protein